MSFRSVLAGVLLSYCLSIQSWVHENFIENNFKNYSSETGNNKELQAECDDPPYTKYLMNSKLRKWITLHERRTAFTDCFMAWREQHLKTKDSNQIGLDRLISSILVKWFILPSIGAHLCAAVFLTFIP